MKVLITSAQSTLSCAIAEELERDCDLRVVDSVDFTAPAGDFVKVDHLISSTLAAAVTGVDAVVHSGELPSDPPEGDAGKLDWYTRGTYELMAAAIDAGVKKFVYCGTLDLFKTYADDVYISEMHEPFPPPNGQTLWRYLAELTVREFVRDCAITGTGLRLGTLISEDEADPQALDPSWLDPRDSARVVRMALDRDDCSELNWVNRWRLRHVCAIPPNHRFLIDSMIQGVCEHHFEAAGQERAL